MDNLFVAGVTGRETRNLSGSTKTVPETRSTKRRVFQKKVETCTYRGKVQYVQNPFTTGESVLKELVRPLPSRVWVSER